MYCMYWPWKFPAVNVSPWRGSHQQCSENKERNILAHLCLGELFFLLRLKKQQHLKGGEEEIKTIVKTVCHGHAQISYNLQEKTSVGLWRSSCEPHKVKQQKKKQKHNTTTTRPLVRQCIDMLLRKTHGIVSDDFWAAASITLNMEMLTQEKIIIILLKLASKRQDTLSSQSDSTVLRKALAL